MQERRFLVVLTVGLNNAGVCRSALMFATIAQVSGMLTTVYAVQEGADVLVRGALDEEMPAFEGAPTVRSRLSEATEAGVALQVCQATAHYKGLRPDDMIDGVSIVGGATLIESAVGAEGVLTF